MRSSQGRLFLIGQTLTLEPEILPLAAPPWSEAWRSPRCPLVGADPDARTHGPQRCSGRGLRLGPFSLQRTEHKAWVLERLRFRSQFVRLRPV